MNQDWSMPACLRDRTSTCDAFLLDVDADGRNELLIPDARNATVMSQNSTGQWQRSGSIDGLSACSKDLQALKDGNYAMVASPQRDIQIGQVRYTIDSLNPLADTVACSQ